MSTTVDNPVNTIDSLAREVSELRADIERLQATQDEILTVFRDVQAQAKPLIDGIANSPILKMIPGVNLSND